MATNERRAADGTFAAHDPSERFWKKVDKSGAGGCWLWTANVSQGGYGRFWTKAPGEKVKSHQAHRWAYEDLVGPIPEGLTLDHLCRVRRCVNPCHMEPVTMGVNVNRGNPNWKQRLARTHCPKGHAFDEANTHILPDGSRRCRACNAAATRRYKAKKRAAK